MATWSSSVPSNELARFSRSSTSRFSAENGRGTEFKSVSGILSDRTSQRLSRLSSVEMTFSIPWRVLIPPNSVDTVIGADLAKTGANVSVSSSEEAPVTLSCWAEMALALRGEVTRL